MPTLTTSKILRSVADNYHISVWKTDNTSTGSSANNQVTLPLESTGTYNFVVDWGDGTNNTITTYNQAGVTHTYANIGTYTIKISGVCKGFRFSNAGDILKILDIQRWGKDFEIGNSGNYFYGCANLIVSAIDMLRNPTMSTLTYAFRGCTSLNHFINIDTSNISSIRSILHGCTIFNQLFISNTSNVTDMGYAFYLDSNFNQDISNWNIEKVTTMENILAGATAWSRANYDLALIAWANQNVQNNVAFRCSTKYTLGGAAEAARNHLQNVHNWTITDSGGI